MRPVPTLLSPALHMRPTLLSPARHASPSLLLAGPDDPFLYSFMLPVSTAVATSCQLCGIGGAALFSPIFLLIFPLLGPQYPLDSSAAAIASALLTETFGFASGLTGYASRGLVDWPTARQFVAASVPMALAGALAAGSIAAEPALLRGTYALLMLSISAYLVLTPTAAALATEECALPDGAREGGGELTSRTRVAADGRAFTFYAAPQADARSTGVTAGGSFLTGLLGVGVGEVVLPQLVKQCCMPLPLAAGTSVAVVVVTAAVAAAVQFAALAQATGGALVDAVPWSLVQWTIPGVLLGGQLAPFLATRQAFDDEQIERFAAGLFAVVGAAFAAKALQGG